MGDLRIANGLHFAVDTTGKAELVHLAMAALRPRGRMALLTGDMAARPYPEGKKPIAVIQGDAVPGHFIPRLIELYRAGRFPFDRLVKRYPFADINEAIADARKGDTIKPVLRVGDP